MPDVAAEPSRGGSHEQRIQNGFFGRLNRRLEEQIKILIGNEVASRGGRGDRSGCAYSKRVVPAAAGEVRAGSGHAGERPARQSFKLTGVEGGVGGQHDGARIPRVRGLWHLPLP